MNLNIKILSSMFVFIVYGVCTVFSQTLVTASDADPCVCSGSVNFTSPIVSPALISVYDYQGNLVNSVNSPNGQYALGNLCPQPYSLVVVQNGQTSNFVFNVAAGGVNLGNAVMIDLCSSAGNTNLNNLISGIAAGGIWHNTNGQPIGNILNASNAVDGWYTYQMVGACEIVTGVLVNFIQNSNAGLSTTYIICEDYSPFELLTPMQDSPDPGGQWYFASTGLPMDGWFYPATMNSQQFYYTISSVPGCGPPLTSVLTITEHQIPSPGVSQSIEVCSNAASFDMLGELGGSPQTGGTWYSPTNVPVSNIFNPATQPAGEYRYQIIGQTPCSTQESFLTISFLNDNPSGESGTVQLCVTDAPINMMDYLNGNPLAGGTWRNSANQIVDGIFNPANEAPGNYTYYYPNVGCSSVQTVLSVTVQQAPNAGNDATTVICESIGTFNLNTLLSPGANAGGQWTNAAGQVVSNNIIVDGTVASQQYTYTVSNASCPIDEAEFTLNVSSILPALTDQSTQFCATDAQVNLLIYYPGFPSLQFSTSGGVAVNNLFDPSTQSSVVYQVTNPSTGGCQGSQALLTIEVEEPSFETSSIDVDVCQSDLVYDLNNSSASIDFMNGQWYDASQTATPSQVNLDFVGTETFQFISNSELICASSSYSVSVNSFEQFTAGEDNAVTFCNSDSQVSILDLAGSLGSGNGVWTFANQPVNTLVFDPSVDVPGVFTYTVPANGACPEETSNLTIHVQYGLNYTAGQDITACFNSPPSALGAAGNSGTTYQWSPSTNLSSTNSASPLVNFFSTNSQPVSIVYTVVATDGVCTMEDQVTVTTLPRPTSNLANEYQICRGEAVNLSVIGNNLTCNWMPAALFVNTSQFQIVQPTNTTDVEVIITNEWDCVEYDSTTITVHQLPQVSFIPEAIPGCPPLQVSYEYYPATNEIVTWNIPGVGSFYGNELHTVLYEPGMYDLILNATSSFGCTRSVHYTDMIEVYPEPFADFEIIPEMITTVDPIASFLNTSVNAISYSWNFNNHGSSSEVSPVFEFPNHEPTTFEICLQAENEFGCLDTRCQFLPLQNIYIFYAPTAITPDDDNINDGFKPVVIGFEEETYSLRIYNRWGEKVFETNDMNEAWMANSNGGSYYVPDGIYTWRVEVKEKILANFEIFEGHVVVIR